MLCYKVSKGKGSATAHIITVPTIFGTINLKNDVFELLNSIGGEDVVDGVYIQGPVEMCFYEQKLTRPLNVGLSVNGSILRYYFHRRDIVTSTMTKDYHCQKIAGDDCSQSTDSEVEYKIYILNRAFYVGSEENFKSAAKLYHFYDMEWFVKDVERISTLIDTVLQTKRNIVVSLHFQYLFSDVNVIGGLRDKGYNIEVIK